jgi:hypothetical protein
LELRTATAGVLSKFSAENYVGLKIEYSSEPFSEEKSMSDYFIFSLTTACAPANLAIGTLKGEQETYVNPSL